MKAIKVQKGNFVISTDKTKLELNVIHDFLANHASWSKDIPLEKVILAIENSLNFGLYHKDKQIGYARIISDFSSIAYLGDVFILEAYRKKGLASWLVDSIMSHPELQDLRRWILLTGDAHALYKKHGWMPIESPYKWMEKVNLNIYK